MSEIPGTTVFTGEPSQQGYRLNRMAMSLTDSANRERFRADVISTDSAPPRSM